MDLQLRHSPSVGLELGAKVCFPCLSPRQSTSQRIVFTRTLKKLNYGVAVYIGLLKFGVKRNCDVA